ncbi:MAG TPA: class I SAM-dependent methyltransferase [Phenylobacterium sp.]
MDARLVRHPLGFLQVAEPPSPEDLKSYYAQAYYQTEQGNYRKAYPDEELAYLDLKIAQRAQAAFAVRGGEAPGRMLDVGCGEGFALAWFAQRGWTVRGLDHSSAGLAAQNPQLIEKLTTGDVFANLQGLIGAGETYDLVWLNHVLEHVVDPVALLRSLRRLVAPGGVLVVTVPNDASALQEDLLAAGDIPERFWIALPDHLSYFTGESLARTCAETGWTCRDLLADFPIDLFLLHEGSNYVRDRSKGPAAHAARIRLERLLGRQDAHQVNAFYRAMAQVGLGRSLTAFLTPDESTTR